MMKRLRMTMVVLCVALVSCLAIQVLLPLQFAAEAELASSAKIKLNKTKLTIYVGDTYRLKVSGTNKTVKWSSSNKRIVKVNQKGVVTALKMGKAKITAKVGSKKLVCTVTSKSRYLKLKPIIYLYPKEETELNVTLGHPENITVSYPAYGDGWHVLAQPDGTLKDLDSGRSLYALYWEGKSDKESQMDEGFVVAGSDTTAFLEEKLAILGLTEREAEEFIVYWLPQMQNNPYNLIRFESLEEIDSDMPLTISVEPDTVIRVMMLYKPLEEAMEIPEQVLPPTPDRTGFTVVEWGGSKLD